MLQSSMYHLKFLTISTRTLCFWPKIIMREHMPLSETIKL